MEIISLSNEAGYPQYSIVIPVRDEAESVAPLAESILRVADTSAPGLVRIVFVDDGSNDATWENIERLSVRYDVVRGIRLRRNFGKAAALSVGMKSAEGDVVFTMDGDLQDDPAEIPAFLRALASGYDVVSGWKKERHDPRSKTLPSLFFNRFTAKVTGIPLHDFNCGFKAYRRQTITSVNLYGELHRYIPVLAHALGYRIGEIEVLHHARRHGHSKYGASRLLKGFIDLLTVMVLTRYLHSPAHLIGGAGVLAAAAGLLLAVLLLVVYVFGALSTAVLGILLLAWFSVFSGILMLASGLVAEVVTYTRISKFEPIAIIAEHTKVQTGAAQ